MKGIYTLLMLMLLSVSSTHAQEGPIVPCVGCDSLTHAPFPESGLWFNPEQTPGSGLNFEIQNGVLAGFFYGYSAEGKPEWQLVSGALVPSAVEGVLWELETTFTRAEGGSCIGCEFKPPEITAGATIRLEFMQRNYMRIRIGGIFDQFFVPFIYGSDAVAYFPNKTPYLFPTYDGTFVLAEKPNPEQGGMLAWESKVVGIARARRSINGNTIIYDIWGVSFIQDVQIGTIKCALDATSGDPGCIMEIGGSVYIISIGNMGDAQFFGETEDGSTVRGVRLSYD